MKRSAFLGILFLPTAVFILAHSISSSGQAEDALPYLLNTSIQLEYAGFPVGYPAVESGSVKSVTGVVVGWSPSFQDRPFGTALPVGEEYYAEVIGPSTHPWLGHRFELDEAATRTRSDNGLVVAVSPFNTRGTPNQTLAGANLEVRRHLTVDGLWGGSVRNRILFGGEKSPSFSFLVSTPGAPNGSRTIKPSLDSANVLRWVDVNSPSSKLVSPVIIPPGTCVGVDFGDRRGSSLGFSGAARTWPTAVPLQAGANLLAYPYCADLRLGIDWGTSKEGFKGSAKPSSNQDRIEILEGASRRSYSPELQPDGRLRWRLMDPVLTSGRWMNPPSYLDRIPVGEGFILQKIKADPNHFFRPPQP